MNQPPPIAFVDLPGQHRALREQILSVISRVLEHGQFVGGPEIRELETWWASTCHTQHAIGVGSGTDAIQLALMTLGIGPGDDVITSPNSFVASANAIRLTGAAVRFADIGDDFNLDPDAVSAALTSSTKAILPVHLGGRPARFDRLASLRREGIFLVEDAAQAFGARLDGKPVGSLGDIGCFSLHPLKVLNACGDAGMVTCNDPYYDERLRRLANHGIRKRQEDCSLVGMNSRLDTIQAAILLVKRAHVDAWIEQRRSHADVYRRRLETLMTIPPESPDEFVTYATFPTLAPARNRLVRFLKDHQVSAKIHYALPLHRLPAYRNQFRDGRFPRAEHQARHGLSLPIHEGLTGDEIHRVCDLIKAFYEGTQKPQIVHASATQP